MHPVQKHLFDTKFRDLAGTHIEGTLALSEELINLGIMDLINGLKAPAAATEKAPSLKPEGAPDPQELVKMLNIETLRVRMESGKLLVDVKAGL